MISAGESWEITKAKLLQWFVSQEDSIHFTFDPDHWVPEAIPESWSWIKFPSATESHLGLVQCLSLASILIVMMSLPLVGWMLVVALFPYFIGLFYFHSRCFHFLSQSSSVFLLFYFSSLWQAERFIMNIWCSFNGCPSPNPWKR